VEDKVVLLLLASCFFFSKDFSRMTSLGLWRTCLIHCTVT
jgi:hypothetical protein